MTFPDPACLPLYEQLPEEVRTYLVHQRDALATRTVLGQATGLMASQAGVTTDEAWEVLTVLSNMSNVRVAIVAQILVDAHNDAYNDAQTTVDPGTIARVTSRLAEAAQRVKAQRPVSLSSRMDRQSTARTPTGS